MSDSPESDFRNAYADAVLFGPRRLPIWRISGADAVRYLHGRVTQNIKSLEPGRTARSLVITPQGKIQGQFQIYREPGSLLIISDPLSTKEAADNFLGALLQFKVADDVTAEDLSDTLEVYSAIGPNAEALAKKISPDPKNILPRAWGKLPGFDILSAPGTGTAHVAAQVADPLALEMIRISEKVPRMEIDLSEKILGPEIDVGELVSFDKGCYAGQEVVEMATARGRPNRMLGVFEGSSSGELPASGTEIFTEGEPGKSAGWLTSSVAFPSEKKFRALGFLKTAALDEPLVNLKRIG